MTIKIPQDIKDVLESNNGHEPTAFIDIYEERGDFDVIDTQNQLKAAGDPAVVNDVNIDFDRKPGFAILAPGKRVDSISTAVQSGWGSSNVDLTPLGGIVYFRMRSLHNIGNNVIVGFANYSTVSMNNVDLKIAQITSTDGGDTYTASDIGLPANNILGLSDTGLPVRIDRSTVFDNLLLCDNHGNIVEYTTGNPTPVIYNASVNGVTGGGVAAKIGGIYFVSQPGAGGSTKIYYSDSPTMAGKLSRTMGSPLFIYTIGNDIHLATNADIYKATLGGNASSLSWFLYSTPQMRTEKVKIALSNGSLIGSFNQNISNGNFEYKYSNDTGLTASTLTLTTQKTANSSIELVAYQSNGKDQYFTLILGETDGAGVTVYSIYKTSDGLNWVEYYNKLSTPSGISAIHQYMAVTSTNGGHVSAITADPDTTLPAKALSFTDNSTSGVGVTDSFEYNVVVSDEYIIDQGKGKK